MEQHPIPQNVSSYQFKLVGDMTLKQFFQLAGGLVIGLIIYSSPLLPVIKWPLALFSGILGALLAFVPLEERPMERWIFAFFKAIYAPTEFYWEKTTTLPKLFQDEPSEGPQTQPQTAGNSEYLNSTTQKSSALGKLEEGESGFLANLGKIFSGDTLQPTSQPIVQAAPAMPRANESPLQPTSLPIIQTTPAMPKTAMPTVKEEIKVPQTAAIRVTPPTNTRLIVEEKPVNQGNPNGYISTQEVKPIVAGNEFVSTKQAIFSIDAAPPNPPTAPNVIVGQVVDENRKIIEGAIIEIRDSAGRPVRALRSNKAGHFVTVTPLDTGRYDIITEKEGYSFSPVSFEAGGNLVPPILVQGRKLESRIENLESSKAVIQSSLSQNYA